MKYMELLADDGTVVGAVAAEQPNYVRYVRRHGIFVSCTEKEAQAVSVDNQICYLTGHEDIKSVRDDILLNAVFIDKGEYDRLEYLATLEPETEEQQEAGENEPSEQAPSEVMSDLDVRVELLKLRSEVDNLKQGPIQDEATTRFYQTISNPNTNSIAKIRAAAQQYLDDTSSTTTEEEGGSNV